MRNGFSGDKREMKHLPDILTSTTFWSAVLTIWAAVGAWFTFVAAARVSRRQTHADIMNLLAGIEAELDLVSLWASGSETIRATCNQTTRRNSPKNILIGFIRVVRYSLSTRRRCRVLQRRHNFAICPKLCVLLFG